jgi:hypothetical protein
MAASERVAWGVAASLAASVPGRDDVPPWARPRTGGAAGTSAGLLFALADLDVLTPGRLAGGLRVAATGSIGADGSVTSVRMMEAKLTAAALAGADVVFAADFPAGAAPFTAVESHVGVPAGDRTIGDWLATDAYEAAGRAAARSGRRALVAVDDVRQAVAWLCGRTNEAATCAVSHTAAAVPLATVRSRSLPAGSGLRLVGAMMR